MDKYNTVCFLLSYGLDIHEIARRVKLTNSRVRSIIEEQKEKLFNREKDGYTFTINTKGEIVRRKVL